MRILSQDGMIDVPYENFVFSIIKDNYIIAIRDAVARPSEIVQGVVTRYSTETKARKAMEMLCKAYMSYSLFKIMSENQRAITMNIVPEEEKQYLHGYFRFPADEDLEVKNG